jgi:hypothetical protein
MRLEPDEPGTSGLRRACGGIARKAIELGSRQQRGKAPSAVRVVPDAQIILTIA